MLYREIGFFPAPATVETLLLTYGVVQMHHKVPKGCAMVDIYYTQRYPVIKVAPEAPPWGIIGVGLRTGSGKCRDLIIDLCSGSISGPPSNIYLMVE